MRKAIFTGLLFMFLALLSSGLYAQGVTLTYPANKAAGISIEPTLRWEAITGATYRLQIATTKTFDPGTVKYDNPSIVDAFGIMNLPSQRLENNKQYFWRVVANVNNQTIVSDTFTFYTTVAVLPVLSNPVGGALIYGSSVIFSWYTNFYTPGVKYDVLVSKTKSSDGQLVNPQTVSSDLALSSATIELSTLDKGIPYYWQVRSKTSTGATCSYSASESFKTPDAPLALKPIVSWPVGSAALFTTSPTLFWYLDAANPGLEFRVYYTDVTAGSAQMVTDWTTSLSTQLGHLVAGHHYYWKVRSRLISNPAIPSDYSAEADFWVDPSLALTAQIPVPSWPSGEATVYSANVRFSWYLEKYVPGLQYSIRYQEQPAGEYKYTGWTANSYMTVPNLTPGKTYKWWVKSTLDPVNDLPGSGWSNPETFTIDPGIVPAAVIPTPSWPIAGASVYTRTPTLYWYAASGVQGLQYKVKYSTNPNFPPTSSEERTVTLSPIDGTSLKITTPLEVGRTYYWKVASKLSDAVEYTPYSDTASFYVVPPVPVEALQPVASSPAEGSVVNSTTVKFSWFVPGSSAGLKYRLQVSNYPFDEKYLIVNINELTATNFTKSGLTPGATYAWRVYSYEAAHTSNRSDFSVVSNFTVSPGASGVLVPLTGSPVGGVEVKTESPVLSWFIPAASSPLKYEIQYSPNQDMSNAKSLTGIESTNKALSGLNAGTTYYWRVRSLNSDGKPSEFSGVESFIAASATGVENENNSLRPGKFEVSQNYPNPFNPSTAIKVSLPVASFVTVKIYNMLGQEVRTLLNTQASSGVHTLTWHGEDNSGNILPSGSYIYRVTAGENVTTGKMMFLK